MLNLWLVCLLFCVLVVLVMRTRLKESHKFKLPPFQKGTLPIIGITHMFLCDQLHFWEVLKQISEDCIKQGGVTVSKIGRDTFYFVTDPEDALTVANSCLQRNFFYKFFKPLVGEGLVTATVPIWQRHRKLLNPAFSLPIINGYLKVFNAQIRKLTEEIEAHSDKGLFDPSLTIKNTILTISCLNVFGTSEMHDSEYFKKYIKAVEELLFNTTTRFQKFWLQSDIIYKLCGGKKKEDEFIKILMEMSKEIIEDKKNALRNGQEQTDELKNKTLLEIILPMTIKEVLTDTEVKEELDTAVIAAYETTANTLQCILLLLGSNPDIQERVFEELIQVLGPERDVEKEDVTKLVYVEAVIKETLRYLPVVPLLFRYVDRDVKLKNYTIPTGSQVGILVYGTHRDPVWGTDADSFRPDRWLKTASLPVNANAFIGFGAGKRNCIGKTYAITALKVALAHLVRRYKIQADYSKVKYKFTVALKPEFGNEISIQPRELY